MKMEFRSYKTEVKVMKRLLGVLMLLAVGGANAADYSNLVVVEAALVGAQGYDWLLQNNFTDKVASLTPAALAVVDAAPAVVDAALAGVDDAPAVLVPADVNLVSLEKELLDGGHDYVWLLQTSLQDKLGESSRVSTAGLFGDEDFEEESEGVMRERIGKREAARLAAEAAAAAKEAMLAEAAIKIQAAAAAAVAAEAALEEELGNLISKFESEQLSQILVAAKGSGAELLGSKLFYILTHLPRKFKQQGKKIVSLAKTDVENINKFITNFVSLLENAAFIENEDLVSKLYAKLLPSRPIQGRLGSAGSNQQEVSFMQSMKTFYEDNVKADTKQEQLIKLGKYYQQLIKLPYDNTLLQ